MFDLDKAVRSDRIKLFEGFAVKTYPVDATVPGDIVLTSDGDLAWYPVSGKGRAEWESSLAAVSEVKAPPFGFYKSRAFAVTIDGKHYIFYFTGITHFLSKKASLATHIPGYHHVVGMAVLAKSQYVDNMGAKKRAVESADFWRRALAGEIDLTKVQHVAPEDK